MELPIGQKVGLHAPRLEETVHVALPRLASGTGAAMSALPNCDSTNCVCCNHEGWPKRTGAFWTHLYSETPKVVTPCGDRPATQYVVVER